MRKIVLIVIGLMIGMGCFGQASNWLWAKQATGAGGFAAPGGSEGWSICKDPIGNLIIAGEFYDDSAFTFGGITVLHNSTGTSSSTSDAYFAKIDTAGNFLWMKAIEGVLDVYVRGVCTDNDGNIFITGAIYGGNINPNLITDTINFGNNITLICNHNHDNFFVAKFDTNGNALWVRNDSGIGDTWGIGICTDPSGNIIVGGTVTDSTTIGTTTLYSHGGQDGMILKYDNAGNLIWGGALGGTGVDYVLSVCTDNLGNVLMAGAYNSPTLTIGTNTLNIPAVNYNAFTAKLNSSGNPLWIKSGNANNSFGAGSYSICTDASGNSYVCGQYSSPGITFGTYNLTSDSSSVFLIKYDPLGNVLWAKSNTDTIGYANAFIVTIDNNGDLYMTGSFDRSLTFDGVHLTVTPSIYQDPSFILKLNSNGNVMCADMLTGGGDDNLAVATDNIGNVYLAGDYVDNTIIFGNDTLSKPVNSGETAFIAKYRCTSFLSVPEIPNPQSSILIYPNPFTSQTTISFSEEQKHTTIKVVDVVGKEIKIINFSGKQYTIDKGEMSNGIYFVQITDENKNVVNRKIVVQ